MSGVIALLTDFGTDGPYVGAVRGVLLGACPGAVLADITHDVPPHDVRQGAYLLAAAGPWFPPATVFLAVVDPGVGGARRAIAAALGDCFFVGPDNGLVTLLARRLGLGAVHAIEPARGAGSVPHPTFHGRDVFAPAAAALAAGHGLEALGPPVTDPVLLPRLAPRREGRRIAVPVLHVDRFGNVTTALTPEDCAALGAPGGQGLALGGQRTPFVRTYSEGPAGTPFLLWGSSGYLEIALDRDRADHALGVGTGNEVLFDLP